MIQMSKFKNKNMLTKKGYLRQIYIKWWVEVWGILAGIPVVGEPLGHEDNGMD